jgi:hypothetical protein
MTSPIVASASFANLDIVNLSLFLSFSLSARLDHGIAARPLLAHPAHSATRATFSVAKFSMNFDDASV